MNSKQRRTAKRLPKKLEFQKRCKIDGRKRNNPINKFIKGVVDKINHKEK